MTKPARIDKTRPPASSARRRTLALCLVAGTTALPGCGPKPALRIGFLGGLSDRGAELGEAGRNGVMLAVEERNQAGGIGGRTVELVVEDDGQNPQQAAGAMRRLTQAHVLAVIGPFTSAMAAAVVPIANEARLLTVSPTVTSGDFVGRDDHFVRVNRTTRDNAVDYAAILAARGQTRLAVAYDLRNRSFTESWLNEFRTAIAAKGGSVATAVAFESGADVAFADIVGRLAASRPNGLVFIAQAVDVARLAQQAARLAPGLPMSAAEWAAGEALLELGGRAVEGLLIAQAYNREDPNPRFRAFMAAYAARFGRDPGYAAINAYDAAIVLFESLAQRRGEEPLKETVLRISRFDGLQQTMTFDQFGDTGRRVYFTEVRQGRYALVK
jgi:branched-chain amino acid transport system substrate-binding protein